MYRHVIKSWWLRGVDLNHRPLGYAYRYSFRCLAEPVCGLDFPFALGPVSPPLGRLPSSLYTFACDACHQRLARGYPANGFPDFDR
jgi:hypothetical protein